jgi:hypothetical protein
MLKEYHTIFNLHQQYKHSMAVPSVTNAQGQVSVIQMQWSPEAGAKRTFDQAHHSTIKKKQKTLTPLIHCSTIRLALRPAPYIDHSTTSICIFFLIY